MDSKSPTVWELIGKAFVVLGAVSVMAYFVAEGHEAAQPEGNEKAPIYINTSKSKAISPRDAQKQKPKKYKPIYLPTSKSMAIEQPKEPNASTQSQVYFPSSKSFDAYGGTKKNRGQKKKKEAPQEPKAYPKTYGIPEDINHNYFAQIGAPLVPDALKTKALSFKGPAPYPKLRTDKNA